MKNQSDCVIIININGLFLFVSLVYYEFFGKTKKELLGKNFIFLVHEDGREFTKESIKS